MMKGELKEGLCEKCPIEKFCKHLREVTQFVGCPLKTLIRKEIENYLGWQELQRKLREKYQL